MSFSSHILPDHHRQLRSLLAQPESATPGKIATAMPAPPSPNEARKFADRDW